MATRAENKQRTREALLAGALQLASERGSFSSLSLREVARSAGIAPNGFYRHFATLEEVGKVLASEGGTTLRRMLREVRTVGVADRNMVERSVYAYLDFARENRDHVLFLAIERTGGSMVIRHAVRHELHHIAEEMAQDLVRLGFVGHLPFETIVAICRLVVDVMIGSAADILDTLAAEPAAREQRMAEFVFQVQLIFHGAANWRRKDADQAGSGSALGDE